MTKCLTYFSLTHSLTHSSKSNLIALMNDPETNEILSEKGKITRTEIIAKIQQDK